MKTFELCYLGNATGSHRYRVTCVTENNVKIENRMFGDLFFKKPVLKDLWIGAYCKADTEDENTYGKWERIVSPQVRLDDNVIKEFSIEKRAKLSLAQNLRYEKNKTPDVDSIINDLRGCMFMLNKAEKAAFALYVYQKLS